MHLLLIEVRSVIKMDLDALSADSKTLGVDAAMMIIRDYYGELTLTGNLSLRWICWAISMVFISYLVQELLVNLSMATNAESDPEIKGNDYLDQEVGKHLAERLGRGSWATRRSRQCQHLPAEEEFMTCTTSAEVHLRPLWVSCR